MYLSIDVELELYNTLFLIYNVFCKVRCTFVISAKSYIVIFRVITIVHKLYPINGKELYLKQYHIL